MTAQQGTVEPLGQTGDDRCTRSARVLDAMVDLVQRIGYPKVSVQDVAEHAGIGKGTVYKHWNSKEDIIDDVLVREFDRVHDQFMAHLPRDRRLASLHGTSCVLYRLVMANPVLRAYNTRDARVLGTHVAARANPDALGISLASVLVRPPYLELLRENGLIVEAVCSQEGQLSIEAVVSGFVARAGAAEDTEQVKISSRLMATVLRRAFGPVDPPESANQDRMTAALLAARPLRSGTPRRLAQAPATDER
ncbi:TetR/AcrR family transcriptional regulator [Streptomyces sp. NL15-2K]|uniref:TetR/AcrR family transcriptional regulator n=1 Tax=Streptomyces sp. NL15-2K TaxID=376149 RepID=UPI00155A3320|nr:MULTISPECIES: TetR/AcrR family transcriptional regulator [Actinomycetes]WKX07223.1 TetR/AcrR family transcriptional regulator [Kutzneria buriramensis]